MTAVKKIAVLTSGSKPDVMAKVLGIVHRAITAHLIRKAGYTKNTAQTGAVTMLIAKQSSLFHLSISSL